MAHFTMGWLPWLMRMAAKVPLAFRALNLLLAVRPVEELTKRLAGLEPKRRMISFAPRPLAAWFRRRPTGRREAADDRETVVLWPDTFTNYSADAPGRAAVEVLEAMGYRVVMPKGNVCCGLTWHSTGQLDMTRKVLRDTLDVMEPLLAAGHPIIGLEPSCTVMLQDEIREMLPDDPRARRVAELTTTFGAFAARHLDRGRPWPFGELSTEAGPAAAVCQVHCHQKSAHGYASELRVLEELGVDVAVVGGGCCGLAGNWGFEPGHYDASQALADRELFPTIRASADGTIVLADGFSCRTQIAQGTAAEGVHLAQVLRAALPEASRTAQTSRTVGMIIGRRR
jgi:Fe-S oxidoreductase